MPLTKEDVSNRSLALIGADPITSFDDGSTEAQHCNTIYQGLADAILCEKPWRFCMKQMDLDRLASVPVARWDAAYQLPSDMMRLMAVTIEDEPIVYDRYDDMVYCDATTDDVVTADYIYSTDPSLWLPYFTQAFVFTYAGLLGGAIGRDADLVEKYVGLGDKWITKAATIEAQSQTTRKINMTRFERARGNLRGRSGRLRDDGY